MMVMMAQVLVVTMDRDTRSLRMSQARSLVPASPVVRAAMMRPEEMGSLSAGHREVTVDVHKKLIIPLNRTRKNVCLLKMVPRNLLLKSLQVCKVYI